MSVNPFTQALGQQIHSLPPPIRDHFAMPAGIRHYKGTMTRVWRRGGVRGLLVAPALRLAATADILFPDTGNALAFLSGTESKSRAVPPQWSGHASFVSPT